MIIEKLQSRYVDQVVALQQQIVPYPLDPELAAKNYEEIFNSSDRCILAAREGDEIVGTVSGFCCRGLATTLLAIEDLIVSESLRGGGIGTQLMAAIHDFGRQQGCEYAILVSSGFRKQAHHFYEKIGYTEDVRGFRREL